MQTDEPNNELGIMIDPEHDSYAEDEQIAHARGKHFAASVSEMSRAIVHGMNPHEVGAFWDAFEEHFD